MAKPCSRLILVLTIAAVTVGAGMALCFWYLDPFNAQRFDQTTWTTAGPYDRAAMTRDAIRHVPSGTTEDQVKELLGKPNSIEETQRLTASGPAKAVKTYSY